MMAVILGFVAAAGSFPIAANPYLAAELNTFDVDYWPTHASLLDGAPMGARIDAYPVAALSRALAGQVPRSPLDDYYYRIHVLPRALDLGNLLSPEAHQVEVWNAYFEARSLDAITAANDEGLTLSGPPAPPLSYAPLQSRLYTLDASPVGPPVIDATYEFEFDTETMEFTVIGRRVVVFSWRPNWAEPIVERLEWATEVLASYDGTEQRIALRAAPRRRYEYALLAHEQDAITLDAVLFGWGARSFALPVWTDPTVAASAITSGATVLPVPEVAVQDWRADGLAVLWRSAGDATAVEVESVGAGTVTLKQPIADTWPAGTRIFPGRIARIEGATKVTHPTDTLSLTRIAWAVEDVDAPAVAGYGPTYRGYRVFDLAPNRAEDVESTWARQLAELDFGGLPTFDDASGKPLHSRRMTYLLRSRAEITAIRAWAAERRGRYAPCWLPSWQTDLRVTQPIGGGDTTWTTANIGLSRLVGVDDRRRDLLLRAGGIAYMRRLTAVAQLSATEELIGVDTGLGVSYTPEQITALQWLWFARLDADAIELAWETDAICRLTMTFRLLPAP